MIDFIDLAKNNVVYTDGDLHISNIDFSEISFTLENIIEAMGDKKIRYIKFTNCKHVYMRTEKKINVLSFINCNNIDICNDYDLFITLRDINDIKIFGEGGIRFRNMKSVFNLNIFAEKVQFADVVNSNINLLATKTIYFYGSFNSLTIKFLLSNKVINGLARIYKVEYSNIINIAKYTLIQVDQYLISIDEMKHYIVNWATLEVKSHEVDANILLRRGAIKQVIPYLL